MSNTGVRIGRNASVRVGRCTGNKGGMERAQRDRAGGSRGAG